MEWRPRQDCNFHDQMNARTSNMFDVCKGIHIHKFKRKSLQFMNTEAVLMNAETTCTGVRIACRIIISIR